MARGGIRLKKNQRRNEQEKYTVLFEKRNKDPEDFLKDIAQQMIDKDDEIARLKARIVQLESEISNLNWIISPDRMGR